MKFAIIFDTKEEFDRVSGTMSMSGTVTGSLSAPAPAPAPVPTAAPGIATGPLPVPAAPAPVPSAAGAPPPVPMAAPAPAPAPVAAPPAAPSDPNAPKTLADVVAAVTAFVKAPGKGGAAKVKEILATTYGPTVTKASEIPAEHYGHAVQTFTYYLTA